MGNRNFKKKLVWPLSIFIFALFTLPILTTLFLQRPALFRLTKATDTTVVCDQVPGGKYDVSLKIHSPLYWHIKCNPYYWSGSFPAGTIFPFGMQPVPTPLYQGGFYYAIRTIGQFCGPVRPESGWQDLCRLCGPDYLDCNRLILSGSLSLREIYCRTNSYQLIGQGRFNLKAQNLFYKGIPCYSKVDYDYQGLVTGFLRKY